MMEAMRPNPLWLLLLLVSAACLSARAETTNSVQEAHWWRGNIHTHTLWSDGDDYPEMVVEWYKTNGYHFLALSDHNVLLNKKDKWITVKTNQVAQRALSKYQARFGAAVETRDKSGTNQVRLKTLEEFRPLFEEPGKFLLVPSEEITAYYRTAPIHMNVTNIRELIQPELGGSVREVIQNNVDAVLAQRKRTGRPMIAHLNHPNFGYGVRAEDLMRVRGERFFEVYNGHPAIHNEGDATHPDTERIWDIVLSWRLAILGLEPLFGVAVDDSHNYHEIGRANSNSGRGWIVVRSKSLAAAPLVEAMEKGDFYASTGVRLKEMVRTGDTLSVEAEAEPGVTYKIQMVGTRKAFFQRPEGGPDKFVIDESKIGRVFAETEGPSATYKLKGDELYVRAKVTSSKPQKNAVHTNEFERAWSQPLIPAQ